MTVCTRIFTTVCFTANLNRGYRFWIAGHKLSAGWQWDCLYKGPLITDDWNTGEPNNKRGHEDCMSLDSNGRGRWKDYDCYSKARFICERKDDE